MKKGSLFLLAMSAFALMSMGGCGKKSDDTPDYQFVDAVEDEQLYADSLTELINQQMDSEDFNLEEAVEDEFYSARVIVKGEEINFDDYDIETVIAGPDGTYVVQFASAEEAEKFQKEQETSEQVDYAEPDIYFTLDPGEIMEESTEDDVEIVGDSVSADGTASSGSGMSWGVSYIQADVLAKALADQGYNSQKIVAVVDTGADLSHPYLKGKTVSGYDYVDGDSNPDEGKDGHGHGTHVSGTILDCTSGLNVKIMPIRSLKKMIVNGKVTASGTSSWVASGIRYAANNGASVINLSLGGSHASAIDYAVQYAVGQGVVVCSAAGNANQDTSYHCPAHITTAGNITVSAIYSTGKKADFSNYGSAVDVAAPGVSIKSSYPNNRYALMSGTSMAAPHVAAVAAMFSLIDEDATPAEIEQLVCKYTKDLGTTGRDIYFGYGVNQLKAAVPKKSYTVTFDGNGGEVSQESAKAEEGKSVKLPTPSDKTYTIKYDKNGGAGTLKDQKVSLECLGWATQKSAASAPYTCGSNYTPAKNVTLYAVWPKSASAKINAEEPTREGWIFMGWSADKSALTAEYQKGDMLDVSKNLTLYAVWKEKAAQYKVTFDANGGTVSPKNATVEDGQSVKLPTPSGVSYRIQYNANSGTGAPAAQSVPLTCLGWAETKTAKTADYACGSSYQPLKSGTLYAVWKSSASATVTSSMPTRSGWTFIGWATSASATTSKYAPGETISVTKDTTLYAVWSKDPAKYMVTYDANGGSGAPATQTKVEGNPLTLSTTEPTRSGYRFLGWATSKTATTAAYAPGDSYQTNAPLTLYAVWKQVPVMSTMADITVYVNQVVTKQNPSVTPAASNYTVSYSSDVFKVVENGDTFTVTGLKEGSGTFTMSAVVDGETVSQTCKVTVPTPSITLSSTSGSGEQSAAHTNTCVVYQYSTSPHNSISGDYLGWAVSLPSVNISNLSAGSYNMGWELVSGDAVFSGNTMYIGQPGTVKVRYYYGGRYSPTYTYTLKIYKTTTASNYLRSTPGGTSIGSVPGNTTVYLQEVTYTGTLGQVGCKTYGKVTYGGKTGWIILTEWK